jgi:hypothetical protein
VPETAREVDRHRRPVATCIERRRHRRARVDDQHVATIEVSAEVSEDGVTEGVGPGHEQAHLVASEPAGLGGLARHPLGGELELDGSGR